MRFRRCTTATSTSSPTRRKCPRSRGRFGVRRLGAAFRPRLAAARWQPSCRRESGGKPPHSKCRSIVLTMTAVSTEKAFRNQLFINGEFIAAKSGKTFPTINPATEEKITDVASAGPEDVDVAARAEEIGRVETIDNGKPIFESQFVDTPAAAECLYYFAGWSVKVTGETIPVQENAFTYTLREPVGVVGAITPWNFPLMLAVWKIAPALACGNAVVIKPASNTSLSLLKFAEYAKECGLPAGVL